MFPITYDTPYLDYVKTLLANVRPCRYDLLDCHPDEVEVDVGSGLGHGAATLAQTGVTVIDLDCDAKLLGQPPTARQCSSGSSRPCSKQPMYPVWHGTRAFRPAWPRPTRDRQRFRAHTSDGWEVVDEDARWFYV